MKWLLILLLLTAPAMAQTEPLCPSDRYVTYDAATNRPLCVAGLSVGTTSITAYTPRCPKDYTVVWTGYDIKCAKDLVDPQ